MEKSGSTCLAKGLPSARHVVFPGRTGRPRAAIDVARLCGPGGDAAAMLDLPAAEHDAFLHCVLGQAGLDAGAYRPECLRRRLPAVLRVLGADGVARARANLAQQRRLNGPALSAAVVGVTRFFRDAAVFDALAAEVLPTILRRGAGARVWSAGCADGRELLSVAMLLAERESLAGAALLGTDCRSDAVRAAAAGRYAAAAVADVPAPLRSRYFRPCGAAAWQACDRLLAAARWRTADLLKIREPGAWDLILCRNLSIYLRPEAAGALWAMLEKALRPGGFLIVGRAETPGGASRLGAVGPCVYQRTKG